MKTKHIVWVIALILFIIPLCWLKSGEMDLGGDSVRLYFYDPLAFIKYNSLYNITTLGKGIVEPNYYFLPYVVFIALFRVFFSPSVVMNIFSGFKLSLGFLGIYFIITEMLTGKYEKKERAYIWISASLSGLMYILSFASINMAFFWNRAYTSHDQVFLNPVLFYLIYKFLLTQEKIFLWIAILISFVFASNFGLTSAPPLFAFYPLSMLFLLLYTKLYSHKTFPWKAVLIGILLLFGIQAFQYLGQGISLFDRGSFSNDRVFRNSEIEGIGYFSAIRLYGKVALNILLPSEDTLWHWASIALPFFIFMGFLFNKKRKKEYLLISIFFTLTLFLASANITQLGFDMYRKLFYIPGFSMFRNFYTQWLYIFIFFYALLFGHAAQSIFVVLKQQYVKVLGLIIFIFLLFPCIKFLSGDLVTKPIIRGSNNLRSVFTMNPSYAETISYIKTLPNDGKFLVLPLTDFFYQLIYGANGGVYEGPSSITYLTGKYSFVGYQHFGFRDYDPAPYAEDIRTYACEKNYDRLKNIFATLNIRYILFDDNPKIYDQSLTTAGPFLYMAKCLPNTIEGYSEFLTHFPVHQIYKNGSYTVFEIEKNAYNPTIFIPDGIYQSNILKFDSELIHNVFISDSICGQKYIQHLCLLEYKKPKVDISSDMINLGSYEVKVHVDDPSEEIFLVLQHTFHKSWKLFFNGKVIADDSHIPVNGYANGWLIPKDTFTSSGDYIVYITMDQQKYFWYGWSITIISLGIIFHFMKRTY